MEVREEDGREGGFREGVNWGDNYKQVGAVVLLKLWSSWEDAYGRH